MLIVLVPILFLIDLLTGSASISLPEILDVFLNNNIHDNNSYIILQLRLPRVLTAIVTGIGLAMAGLFMQTMFRNPLAGPYVLGISSGAGLGVAVYLLSATFFVSWFNLQLNYSTSGGIIIASVIGAGILFLLIISVSFRLADSVSLLIIGIMFGSLSSALISLMEFFAESEQIHRYVMWSMGSLTGTTWLHLKYMIPVIMLSVIVGIILIKPADALLLGDVHAITSGVKLKRTKILIVLLASISSGAITAFVGPIAFIGMAIPHLTRFIFRTSVHKILVPGIILVGAGVMLICDILTQLPAATVNLPVNAVTVLFGAPVIIILILRNRRLNSTY